jgi:CheY-like chemotaxis protein
MIKLRATLPIAAVLDMHMPEMDGTELARTIQKGASTAASMVLLTGADRPRSAATT